MQTLRYRAHLCSAYMNRHERNAFATQVVPPPSASLTEASIKALCETGQVDRALDALLPLSEPSDHIYMALLKACNKRKYLLHAQFVHYHITKHTGSSPNGSLGNYLVTTLAKCGAVEDAYDVFKGLSKRNAVTWTLILSSYIDIGRVRDAIGIYECMREEGIMPDASTFVRLLKACGSLSNLEAGKKLHLDAEHMNYISNVYVNTTLISMYGKCKSMTLAENVFSGLIERNIVTWNAMLTVYVEQEQAERALQLYRQLHEEGINPNERTIMTSIQACGILGDKLEKGVKHGYVSTKSISLHIGRALHSEAWRKGFVSHVFVSNTLLSMYGKCGSVNEAEFVFNSLSDCDVVSWNAMLSTFIDNGEARKALQLYKKLREEKMTPNTLTLTMALQACGILTEKKETFGLDQISSKMVAWKIGKGLHHDIRENGQDVDVFVGSALVNMYGKCGTIAEAENVFLGLNHVDIVSLNAMLSAYVDQGEGERALALFTDTQKEQLGMDMTTILCLLQACRQTGIMDTCWELYFTFISSGHTMSALLATTLIHVFGSFASIEDAQAIFDLVCYPNVAIWTANITGYAREGSFISCLQLFEEMQFCGITPNDVTYLLLLYVCNHAGMVDKASAYFKCINIDVGTLPNLRHYACMMDILGRAGDFCKVLNMLKIMPLEGDLSFWMGLLGACRIHGNADLGKHAFDLAVQLHPKEASAYIMMSNIYGDAYNQHHDDLV